MRTVAFLLLCLLSTLAASAATEQVRVAASSDDAEEKADGSVRTTSSDLEFVFETSDQTVGMRFVGVDIPAGANIVSAYIQFQSDERDSGATDLTIEAEAADDPTTFSRVDFDISSRSRTAASTNWIPAPWPTKGVAGPDQQTPDISAIIQELVDRPGWASGNAMVAIISGTGLRVAEAYDGIAAAAAELNIDYEDGTCGNDLREGSEVCDGVDLNGETCVSLGLDSGTLGCAIDCSDFDTSNCVCNDSDLDTVCDILDNCPVDANQDQADADADGDGDVCDVCPDDFDNDIDGDLVCGDVDNCPVDHNPAQTDSDEDGLGDVCDPNPFDTSVDVRIGTSDDDAEERSSGSVTLTSSDLELVEDSSTQTVGLRFTPVDIPQGVSVAAAWVQFQVDERTSVATDLTIEGQAHDDAPALTSARFDITSRTPTAATVAWSPPAWNSVGEAGPDQQTADISPIIEEIVGRSGWTSGNSIVLMISGAGKRVAESYNGSTTGAALLHVDYDVGVCGNDLQEGSELCDGVDLGGESCSSQGFDGGFLACSVDCSAFDVAGCFCNADSDSDGVCDSGDNCPDDSNSDQADGDGDGDGDVCDVCPDDFDNDIDADLVCGDVDNCPDDYNPDQADSDTDGIGDVCDIVVLILDVAVGASTDDAEERSNGHVSTTSRDLELVDEDYNQTVGVRFPGVAIDPGAIVAAAWVQFTVDEPTTNSASLTVTGEATDNPVTFSRTNYDITSRPLTAASVAWDPVAWDTTGDKGVDQQTPDISAVIQEIVDRSGWANGNAIVIFISGSGTRAAESWEGDPDPAILHIELQ